MSTINISAGGALPKMSPYDTNSAMHIRAMLQVDGFDDPLSILGLYYQANVTEKDIIVAFRKLALILHPDKCQDAGQSELHVRLFQKLETAKEALLNSDELLELTPEPLAIHEGPETLRIRIFDAREKLKAARAEAVIYNRLPPKLQRGWIRAKLVREFKAAGAHAHELRKEGKQSEAHTILTAAKEKLQGFNRVDENGERVFDDPTVRDHNWNKNLVKGRTSTTTGVSFELKKRQDQLFIAQEFEEMYKIAPERLHETEEEMWERWLDEDYKGWTKKVTDANGQSWWLCEANMEAEMLEIAQRFAETRWIQSSNGWKRWLYLEDDEEDDEEW
ncbi:hypothetical protein CB0940_03742 [Cercospora beticola]|uniref:J domain-containing protein n=1 Tax=Cercospora beticola TaxID=122368 RepID=A0A2G5I432_CERBT|nr:hypothetical protein CB0940_03742 [Cercospora beticola]PIA99530.1 hypothetical protein CB0940_03742 [Cercospora beticola]WPB00934.1 hypothetical protein RHO25_005554 [Cercospora beticola]